MIYADHAATTRLDQDAFEAMKPWLTEQYGNPSQPYSFARPAKKALREAREMIADCIGAEPEEIFFTSGGTESDNWAIHGVGANIKKGVITSAIERHAILRPCEFLKETGAVVKLLYPDRNGVIQPEVFRETLREMRDKIKLASIMYANNELGTIQPIRELCEIAHDFGVCFHTDAVQAVGHVEINLKKLGADALSASAHKFYGPRGVGFLYIRKGIELAPFLRGGAQENGYRAGTENVAAIVGMAAALKNACRTLKEDIAYITGLERVFLRELSASGVYFIHNGAESERLPGLISLSFPDQEGEMILHRMDLMGICVSTGSACDGQNTRVSHVLQAVGLEERLAKGTIRISLGRDNKPDEMKKIAAALRKILE